MNKKVVGIIVAIALIVGAAYLIMHAQKKSQTTENPSTASTNGSGRVVFAISDAASDMSTISKINMTVSSVDVHQQAGWTTVSGTPRTYDLLALNATNKSMVMADFRAPAGTYDMVRLNVDKVAIVTKDGMTKEAKLPSGVLKINTTLIVKEGETSSVNFDFLADKSLHTAGNGEYIFAPVIHTQSKSSVDVTVQADSSVKIGSGHAEDDQNDGMDINGDVKENFEIDANEKLDIEGGMIKVHND